MTDYHDAHLAFARAEIIQAAARREPLMKLLHEYTRAVEAGVRDRLEENPLRDLWKDEELITALFNAHTRGDLRARLRADLEVR